MSGNHSSVFVRNTLGNRPLWAGRLARTAWACLLATAASAPRRPSRPRPPPRPENAGPVQVDSGYRHRRRPDADGFEGHLLRQLP